MANYEKFISSIERAEGGYQNLEKDKGNYNSLKERVGTNYGISAKFYERIIRRPPSIEDMKGITQNKAHKLFKNEFWDKVQADKIRNQGVAEIIVDHAINANPTVITKIVQRVLNEDFDKNLRVDGGFGYKTLMAVNSVDQRKLFALVGVQRINYYKRLKDYQYFGRSWTKRVFDLSEKFNIEIKKKLLY